MPKKSRKASKIKKKAEEKQTKEKEDPLVNVHFSSYIYTNKGDPQLPQKDTAESVDNINFETIVRVRKSVFEAVKDDAIRRGRTHNPTGNKDPNFPAVVLDEKGGKFCQSIIQCAFDKVLDLGIWQCNGKEGCKNPANGFFGMHVPLLANDPPLILTPFSLAACENPTCQMLCKKALNPNNEMFPLHGVVRTCDYCKKLESIPENPVSACACHTLPITVPRNVKVRVKRKRESPLPAWYGGIYIIYIIIAHLIISSRILVTC
jgi:hypothetical protein